MNAYSIQVDGISKQYRLFNRNSDRIKETFHPFRKQYHKPFSALQDVSFMVQKGESVGVIGRNGSGKSTLLQILCGVLQPSSGTVDVKGRISALLELGAGFDPEFTGRENVYLSATIIGLSKEYVDDNIQKIIDFADIGEYLDQPVKLYSSGMYVRLAFATAISVEPEILIVDEALSVGDIFFQQKCAAYMKEMLKSATVVFVTHDMHSVTNLCDRVILLDQGRVVFEGDPVDGVSQYTKLIHNNNFQSTHDKANSEQQTEAGNNEENRAEFEVDEETGWVVVEDKDRGGALEVKINRVRLVGEDFSTKETVIAGERVLVQLVLESRKSIENLIIGYTVKDRVGNSIFGENTCSSMSESIVLEAGGSVVTYEFTWPEVYAQTYTITVGIGEGDDPFVHKIHCWAHNVVSIAALTPGKKVHGIFSNRIQGCEIKPIKGN